MNFDQIIDRRGTHTEKWDGMEDLTGVSPDDGLAMWVADMDFRAPDSVNQVLQKLTDHGVHGYYGDKDSYFSAIQNWMQTRHGWSIEPDWIFTSHGTVNGAALCLHTWTKPGDAVVLFTPVYHGLARIINASDRTVTECPLAYTDGRYEMDFDDAQSRLSGRETMVMLCSPHNPGGRVWSREELRAFAEFAERNNLFIISDEIHHDLTFADQKHHVLPTVAPELSDRMAVLSGPTKTFNLAGIHNCNITVSDEQRRTEFAKTIKGLSISAGSFGYHLTTAAYSDCGAKWLDELMVYLDTNRKIFDAGISSIPGLRSMQLEATYLSWVDFSGTGMSADEINTRLTKGAKIAASEGKVFGTGGEDFRRFNIGMPKARIQEAVERLKHAFADLQ